MTTESKELEGEIAEGKEMSFAEIRKCLVTGGAGFFGGYLVRELLDRGYEVNMLDLVTGNIVHERLSVFTGDIRNYADVLKAMEGVDTVFHSAAVVDLLHYYSATARERSQTINVEGAKNVLRACKTLGVPRLVYTSSVNVIFDGKSVVGMCHESASYPTKYHDLYSETKAVAEQEVLGANCDELRTCAIRPSGIYGPGDPLILARVVTECDRGLLKVLIGDGTGLSENSYVDNVVEGHIKAALRLVPDSPVPGQAYFINDGVYCNNLEFFRPIIEGLGFKFPSARIPAGPMVGIASLWELAHKYLRVGRPQLLVMEMRKLTINQPCSIEKAQRELNYGPDVSYEEAMRRSLPYCREVLEAREKVDRPALGWWAVILGGLAALAFVSFHETTWASWSTHVLGFIPRCLYAVGFWVACLVHVHKGLKAVRLAEQAGFHETSLSWGWQTFILGFPSMNKLLGRIAQSRRAGRLGRPREYP